MGTNFMICAAAVQYGEVAASMIIGQSNALSYGVSREDVKCIQQNILKKLAIEIFALSLFLFSNIYPPYYLP